MPVKAPVIKAPAAVVANPWVGPYVGVNGGGGWGSNCWKYLGPYDGACHDPSGALAGGQLGYNWQIGNVVLGAEVSGDWANLKGNNIPALLSQLTQETHVSSVIMATARAGVTWDQTLIYAKGGAAWVRSHYHVTCNGFTGTGFCLPVGAVPAEARETRLGWTVGAGLEYMLAPKFSIGIEYDYIGLGTRDVTFSLLPGYSFGCGSGVACPVRLDQSVQMVTARLNWHFNSP